MKKIYTDARKTAKDKRVHDDLREFRKDLRIASRASRNCNNFGIGLRGSTWPS